MTLPVNNYMNYLTERNFVVNNDGMDIPVADEITLKEKI